MKELIGNTPMIKINYKFKDKIKSIYTKLEYYNLTGSIKDRIAYYIINKAKLEGDLKDNQPIIEATSGNTGISISAIGAFYKHPVYIFMPDWVSKERKKIMELYGAKVYLVSRNEGGFKKCLEKAKQLSKDINGFYFNQFSNENNVIAHYKTTANEIINNLKEVNGFVSGVGSGGTIMGIAKKLKEINENIFIAAIEPNIAPIISQEIIKGSHKIEGIGDDFVPEIVDKKIFDDIFLINDMDSINMTRMLNRELGLGVGISSGANMLGAILLENRIKGNIVTLFPDDNKKYLSTDLVNDNINQNDYISNSIELIDYEVII